MTRESRQGDLFLTATDISGERVRVERSDKISPDSNLKKGRNRFGRAGRALILATAAALALSVIVSQQSRIVAQEAPVTQQEDAPREDNNSCTPADAHDREAQEEFIEGLLGCKQQANRLEAPVDTQAQVLRTARILSCVTSNLTVEELLSKPRKEWGNYATDASDGFMEFGSEAIKSIGVSYETDQSETKGWGYMATYTAEIPGSGQGRVWKNHRPGLVNISLRPGRPTISVDGEPRTFPEIKPSTPERPINYEFYGVSEPQLYGFALWTDDAKNIMSGKVCQFSPTRLSPNAVAPPLGDWNKLAPLGLYR